MDECQLYFAQLDLKSPLKDKWVSIDTEKKTVDVYIVNDMGSRLESEIPRKFVGIL